MKTVVIVSNTSWNIFNFRLGIAKSLKELNYNVVIVAPKDKYSEKLNLEYVYYDLFMDNKGTNPINDLKTVWTFYKLYKKIKPDIVLNYTIKPNIYGTIACSLLNIKTINNISGLGTAFIKENFITTIVKWLYRYSQSKASKVFFQNSDDYKLFIDKSLVDIDKCDLVPGSGVDTKKFAPITDIRRDNIKFLMIARVLKDKGIYEYIDAIKILKDRYDFIEFQLLGEIGVQNKTAIPKGEVDGWVKNGLISYLGTTDDVQNLISKVDCVVLPSYREGTPRSLLESCSMAKPIIATDVAGCREVVDDGINGYLCEVKNSIDLSDKIDKMVNLSNEERKLMGKAGREKVINEFDEKLVINKYIDAIKEII